MTRRIRRTKGMKKSERRKREQVDRVDLISRMPDDILVLILSHLGCLKEEIRTSILSRRWRYLWNSTPSIDISMYSFRNWERNKLREYVYQLLVNRSVDLDTFRLSRQCGFSMSTVRKWIYAAVIRNVKELDLLLQDHFKLPHCLVDCSSLKELRLDLDGGAVGLRNVKRGFKELRVLSLSCVVLYDDDDVVNDFFQNCPLLEELSLFNIAIGKLSLLCISCPKLKELTIRNRDDDEREMCRGIKMSCPKLVFLALIGHVAYNYFFEYCLDSLKQAEIDPKLIENTTRVFPSISHVESLSVDLYFFSQELWRTKREVHEGDARNVFTSDLKRVEFFEFNGEKPELIINLEGREWLQMGFSWDNKAAMYSYFKHYCCVNWC